MASVRTPPTAFDWWTFAVEVTAAVATLGAVIVALVLGVFEVRKFRAEAGARAAEQRRAQAEKVSAWTTMATLPDRPMGGPVPQVRVSNASDEPIYDTTVILPEATNGPPALSQTIGFVPPASSIVERLEVPDLDESNAQAVTVEFRDASGRWWRRNKDGNLEERTGSPSQTV